MRATAMSGTVDQTSVLGSQISGVRTAWLSRPWPSVEPPIAITRPSGSTTVLNFLRAELERAHLAPRRVGGVQVDDVGVGGVRADGEHQDLAVVVHRHATAARRRRCLADGRPGLGVDVHVGGLAGPVLDHEDLAVGGEDGSRVRAQRLGLGQAGQLGPGVVGRVVDLGERGHDALLDLAAHHDLAAVGQGDHGRVPAGRVHRRRGDHGWSTSRRCGPDVEAGAGQLRAAGALLERGAADDDELPAGQAGLEGAEQRRSAGRRWRRW